MSSAVQNVNTSGTEVQSCAESTGEEKETAEDAVNALTASAASATVTDNDTNSPTNFTDESQVVLQDHGISDEADGNKKPNMSDFLLQALDEIEVRVEKMRETARAIDEEKCKLLDSLNTMMQSEAIDHLSEGMRILSHSLQHYPNVMKNLML